MVKQGVYVDDIRLVDEACKKIFNFCTNGAKDMKYEHFKVFVDKSLLCDALLTPKAAQEFFEAQQSANGTVVMKQFMMLVGQIATKKYKEIDVTILHSHDLMQTNEVRVPVVIQDSAPLASLRAAHAAGNSSAAMLRAIHGRTTVVELWVDDGGTTGTVSAHLDLRPTDGTSPATAFGFEVLSYDPRFEGPGALQVIHDPAWVSEDDPGHPACNLNLQRGNRYLVVCSSLAAAAAAAAEAASEPGAGLAGAPTHELACQCSAAVGIKVSGVTAPAAEAPAEEAAPAAAGEGAESPDAGADEEPPAVPEEAEEPAPPAPPTGDNAADDGQQCWGVGGWRLGASKADAMEAVMQWGGALIEHGVVHAGAPVAKHVPAGAALALALLPLPENAPDNCGALITAASLSEKAWSCSSGRVQYRLYEHTGDVAKKAPALECRLCFTLKGLAVCWPLPEPRTADGEVSRRPACVLAAAVASARCKQQRDSQAIAHGVAWSGGVCDAAECLARVTRLAV